MTHSETHFVRGGFKRDPETGATAPPIYQSAGFAQDNPEDLSAIFKGQQFGYVYSRMGNPTVSAFEQHVLKITNARAVVAVSSGMAALSVILDALTEPGDEIISSKSIFGGTYYLLQEVAQHQGITVHFCDTTDIKHYESCINPKTKGIFLESIGNPKCDVPDIPALTQMAKKHNVPVVLDATVTTPYLSKCKEWGVAITWHSATKWMSGTGSTLAGLIIDNGVVRWNKSNQPILTEFIEKFSQLAFAARCKRLRSNKGACLSPLSAFMISQNLESLPVRMDRHCENAQALAIALEKNKFVQSVSYPGLKSHPDHKVAKRLYPKKYGSLISIRLKTKKMAFNLIKNLKLADNLANLGDAKTLVIHPESTIYRDLNKKENEEAGVYDDLVRISVGIEHIDDIIDDFETALRKSK